MIADLRQSFNKGFSASRYEALLRSIERKAPGTLDFRIAETPVFIPGKLKNEMLSICDYILDFIHSEGFAGITENSIPADSRVSGEEGLPSFIAFDFAICHDKEGGLKPQLIEMQGFPTLFAHQVMMGEMMRGYAGVPDHFSDYLGGYDKKSYSKDLTDILLGGLHPDEVILMEIFPEKQKTRIDFALTEAMTGIKTVCYTRIIAEGGKLYYENEGRKMRIQRIYNRMIMDDLHGQQAKGFDLTSPCDVEWVLHPHWFYRISKFLLPFLDRDGIPASYFLNEISMPLPLEEYVLKPLFSFAGTGVRTDVKREDIENIPDPENWILQKKVVYAPAVETPDGPAMAEVRLIYLCKPGMKRPVPAHNLVRLSKGKMSGTRYNLDKEWVGGTIGYFEN